MKSMQNYRRVLLGISLILLSTTMIFQCTQSNERNGAEGEVMTDEQSYQQERSELENDINASIREIDTELERLGTRLEDADGETRVEIETTRTDLREERDRLNESLRELRNSSEDTWDEVERDISVAYEESKRELDRLGDRIERLFDDDVEVRVERRPSR